MYVDGMSDKAIASQLAQEGIPCPFTHDATRSTSGKTWDAGPWTRRLDSTLRLPKMSSIQLRSLFGAEAG